MDKHLVLGLFALYVVAMSLYGILSGSRDASLILVRKIWGRVCGLCLYFCVHVALPLLVGIVFIGLGAVSFSAQSAGAGEKRFSRAVLQLNWHEIREMKKAADKHRQTEVYLSIPICA